MVDFVVINNRWEELGYWSKQKQADLDIGESNDFEFVIPLASYKPQELNFDFIVCLPGTEWGGIIKDIQTNTRSKEVKIRGDCWRGMMAKKIIEPPAGQSHLKLSGELNAVMKTLIGSRFGSLFKVETESTGVSVNNYQFDRYTTLLEGIEKMLLSKNYRLNISFEQGETGEPGWVELSALPIINYSDQVEFSQDSKIDFVTKDYRRGINHLICLGQGEGASRTVIHLYVQRDGTIGSTQYYTGLEERVAIYDFSSVEDAETLRKDGMERLKELRDYKLFSASIRDVELSIGDIVSGRERITGTLVQKPVVRKILKLNKHSHTVEYVLKGEE